MKNLTPANLCLAGSCPAVLEITPEDLRCDVGASCPGVHAIANSGDLIIVGKRLPPELQARMKGKVGDDEHAIIISRALLANVDPFPSNPTASDPYEPIDGNYRDPQVMGDV